MDANVLLECFAGTLQANQGVRQQAELKLKELSVTPGFLGGCLDIIGSSNSNLIDPNVCKAAAVYFKNRIVRYWRPSERSNSAPQGSTGTVFIDNDEKPIIKERILQVIVSSDYHIKQQLIPVLRVLVSFEFPKNWPTLLNDTGSLLQQVPSAADPANPILDEVNYSQLYTGLLCFSEVCRNFRWVKNEDRELELDPIIQQVFPHLLNIGNSIVQHPNEITEFKAEIIKLILKIYKFVTYYDLPKVLQTREAVFSWGEFHGSIINLPAPQYVLQKVNSTEKEKSLLQISKCYKWSLANLYRLFTRYLSSGISKRYNYAEFYKMFLNELIPELIRNILSIIESWCSKQKWLPILAIYYLLQFLLHCVTQKSTWLLIKPIFETLISHFIYPLLCATDEILEVYETDPHEYINMNIDMYDEANTPDIAALGLLVTFVDKRKNSTLDTIINFAYTELTSLINKSPDDLDSAKKIEGVLRIIGCISHYILIPQSKYYSQMEAFLNDLILPNVNSKYEFVKARSFEIAGKLADLEFNENSEYHTVAKVFHLVNENFDIQKNLLPLNLQCALAIQSYLPHQQFKDGMGTIILPTMSKLLELSDEIDNDAISMVMQECVENFSEQLQPFGVDLMSKLVEQFMRIAQEVYSTQNTYADGNGDDVDYDDDNDSSEKVMAAIGLLNTMITVLLSFENSQAILFKLEEVYYPIMEFVFANKIDDFFTEVGELIENSTFLLRLISPTMWKAFALIVSSFEDGIALLYIEELMPALNNYLIFGKLSELGGTGSQEVSQGIYTIFNSILDGDETQIEFNDISFACQLGQNLILSLEQQSIPYIPMVMKKVLPVFKNMIEDKHHVRNNSFDVNVNNVLVSSIVYDLVSSLQVLGEIGLAQIFFERWLKLIPVLKRVFDIKLSVLGLISILNNNEVLGQFDEGFIKQLISALVFLLKILPDAIKSLEERRQNFNELDDAGMQRLWEQEQEAFNNFKGDFNDDEEDFEGEGEEEEGGANDEEYDSFLRQQEENFKLKSSGFYDEEDEQIHEDPLSSTPLDNLNVFKYFKDFLVNLQANELHKYQLLFGTLGDSDQQVVKDIIEIVKE